MSNRALVTVPAGDASYFAGLKPGCRAEVWDRLSAMEALEGAKRGEAYAQALAHWAVRLGMTRKTLQNLKSAYFQVLRAEGAGPAWRVLVNRSKYPMPDEAAGNFPASALPWFRALVRNQATISHVRREMVRQWQAWGKGDLSVEMVRAFEGARPEAGPEGYPVGWSERNIREMARNHVDGWQRVAKQRGLSHVNANLGQVLSSRVKTWPMAQVQWDDMWHNLDVRYYVAGRPQLVRPLQLGALDVHSGCFFRHFPKPRITKADGSRENLREDEMMRALVEVMLTEGYSPRGTMHQVELGTAAIPEWAERLLFDFTGGLVTVRRAPHQGKHPIAEGLWAGDTKGNPRLKALLEKMHWDVQRGLMTLPGQVGNKREHCPEEKKAMKAEELRLYRAVAAGLSARAVALLRYPHLHWEAFTEILAGFYREMNARTDHKLEGWRALGYVEEVYRLADRGEGWMTLEERRQLPAVQEAELYARELAHPSAHARLRRLSPARVFEAGTRENRRMTNELAFLLLEPGARHLETFQGMRPEKLAHRSFFVVTEGGESEFYETRIHETGSQCWRELRQGERYRVIPLGMHGALVATLDGRFLGTAPRVVRINPLDEDELVRAQGLKGERIAGQLQEMREDHAAEGRAVAALRGHNDAVLNGEPITKEEKGAASREARLAAAAREAMRGAFSSTELTEGAEPSADEGTDEGL